MRRRLVLLAPFLLPIAARADPDTSGALSFVRQAGAELAAVVGRVGSPHEKQERLEQFLARVADLDGLARFCLGRYWNAATPAQRSEYTRLFRQVLLRGVLARLGNYQAGSVTVTTNAPIVQAAGIYVPTVVERSGNKPVTISWLVVGTGPEMRIADVVAEGMSLRITQRSDYVSYLSRNGGDVENLIAGMRTQVGE